MNTRKSVSINLASGALLIILTFLFSNTTLASDDCHQFTLTSYVTLLGPTGPAVGFAEAALEDGTVLPITASGEITATENHPDGTIHMRVREQDDWGPLGSTIGLDKITLTPTAVPGEFEMKIRTFIIGESGALEDAFGLYKGRGTASFIDGMLTHTGKGRICNLSLDHDNNSDDDSRD